MSSVRRRVAVAGLVVVPVLMLFSACKDDGSTPFGLTGGSGGGGGAAAAGESTAPATSGGASSSGTANPQLGGGSGSSSGSGELAGLAGVWSGTYHCYQGATTMQLTLAVDGSAITGSFQFQVDSTTGSYSVTGVQAGDKVVLHAGQWINQPDGYSLVDFEITTISPTRLTGNVDGEGCSTFSVTKS
jgi:hypothetical protein